MSYENEEGSPRCHGSTSSARVGRILGQGQTNPQPRRDACDQDKGPDSENNEEHTPLDAAYPVVFVVRRGSPHRGGERVAPYCVVIRRGICAVLAKRRLRRRRRRHNRPRWLVCYPVVRSCDSFCRIAYWRLMPLSRWWLWCAIVPDIWVSCCWIRGAAVPGVICYWAGGLLCSIIPVVIYCRLWCSIIPVVVICSWCLWCRLLNAVVPIIINSRFLLSGWILLVLVRHLSKLV
jgi:hypothetical protein